MGFKEILAGLKARMEKRKAEREELPDDVTRDKQLRSMRRERRVQQEQEEKLRLAKDINEFKKEQSRRYMYGLKETAPEKPGMIKQVSKNILKELKRSPSRATLSRRAAAIRLRGHRRLKRKAKIVGGRVRDVRRYSVASLSGNNLVSQPVFFNNKNSVVKREKLNQSYIGNKGLL